MSSSTLTHPKNCNIFTSLNSRLKSILLSCVPLFSHQVNDYSSASPRGEVLFKVISRSMYEYYTVHEFSPTKSTTLSQIKKKSTTLSHIKNKSTTLSHGKKVWSPSQVCRRLWTEKPFFLQVYVIGHKLMLFSTISFDDKYFPSVLIYTILNCSSAFRTKGGNWIRIPTLLPRWSSSIFTSSLRNFLFRIFTS